MDSSPFAKLPGELRNRIYELALQHRDPITVLPRGHKPTSVYTLPEIRQTLALTRTCSAIRQETTTIFYSINEFEIIATHHRNGTQRALDNFKNMIGSRNTGGLERITVVRVIKDATYPRGRYKESFTHFVKTVFQASKRNPGRTFKARLDIWPWEGTWMSSDVTLDMSHLFETYAKEFNRITKRLLHLERILSNSYRSEIEGLCRMEKLLKGCGEGIVRLVGKTIKFSPIKG